MINLGRDNINAKIKAFVMFLSVALLSLIWIIGMIFADFKFFVIGIFIVGFLIIFYKNFEDAIKNFQRDDGTVRIDERNEIINEKIGRVSFEILMVLMVSAGIAIFTLRDIYPQCLFISYTLFLLVIVSFIIKKIATFYYKRKYD